MSNSSEKSLVDKLKSMEAAEGDIARIPFGFEDSAAFVMMQRAGQLLAASSLVPAQFRGNLADCVIAIEMARRLGASPLAVMQNMYIVHGRPSWSAQFVIACLNASGRFSPLRFEMRGEGSSRACVAWAVETATGERLEGPEVSIAMAKAEGWYDRKSKDGGAASKWPTMPELMLRYRAATFFGRLYAPDIMMGMQTQDEVEERVIEHDNGASDLAEKIRAKGSERKGALDGGWTPPPPEPLDPNLGKPAPEKPLPPVEEAKPEPSSQPPQEIRNTAEKAEVNPAQGQPPPASTRKRVEPPAGMELE